MRPARQHPTGQLAARPTDRESLRNLLPIASRMPGTMVRPHTGALTKVVFSVPTCRRAHLRAVQRLDDVNTAVSVEAPPNERVEPGHRHRPMLLVGNPIRTVFTRLLKPSPVARVERQPNIKRWLLSRAEQHGHCALSPNRTQRSRWTFDDRRRLPHGPSQSTVRAERTVATVRAHLCGSCAARLQRRDAAAFRQMLVSLGPPTRYRRRIYRNNH
jgi:hypothetical protein